MTENDSIAAAKSEKVAMTFDPAGERDASGGQGASAKADAIRRYCRASGWADDPGKVRFLAAGEYNENWLVETPAGVRVFRINHGSQLGLGERQIVYEYNVLHLLRHSGVTPRVYAVDAAPQITEPALSGGVLLMEFLPGRALVYEEDTAKAAAILAGVHSQAVPKAHGLLVQADPVQDIVRESEGLLSRFADHPKKDVQARLLRYRDDVARMGEDSRSLFAQEAPVIVNTEVNSGNFLIDAGRASLVDWEKAVVSCRHQDLGHFLAPTTTLWKTDYTFTVQARKIFLQAYRHAASMQGVSLEYDGLDAATQVMERTILLRGLSWCYMAWYEYSQRDAGRSLRNNETFVTIERYLDGLEWLLQ